MRAVQNCMVLLVTLLFLASCCEALRCYTCMGFDDEDCNRQGSTTCPSHSDACAVVRGQGSGVMKSCSYKSFCSQANSQGYRLPGVRFHCCFFNDCNVTGNTSNLGGSLSYPLLFLPLFLHWIPI
ncbi:CD59A glycoprotein-like [Salmo salar]|uniref:CD59A glycoprotein-like n=1 Tax=Salmo salar TaxID=8030 RepID=A0ABM3E5Q0_SALSA|nr:CD59A glycoprotein-like [Salmo salar]